jgi:hypothetical protein
VNAKLTLRLDDSLITSAKRHSAETGRSISPRVRSLRGVLASSGLDASDYKRHLEERHV